MVVIKLRLYSLAVKVIQLASNGMRVLAGFDVLFKGRFVSMLAEKRRHEWRPMAQGSRDCRPGIIGPSRTREWPPRTRRLRGNTAETGGARGKGGPSLDLEIIAQGEADEKDKDDRKDVLRDHQQLKTFRRNGRRQAISAATRAK